MLFRGRFLTAMLLWGLLMATCVGTAAPAPAPTPERPWIHRYDQTLTMKVMVALKKPSGGTDVLLSPDQTLEVIKRIDSLTLGIPKIIYLVGWQYDGHDSKYPAFFEANAGLKRPQDASALDSLKWLMREAKQYNTTVSVHINLHDAYENSPLWREYVDHDLLIRGSDGKLLPGAIWGGERSYKVCYTREWDAGYTQKRLDKLLELLPIEEAGTVHIDAYITEPCTAQGISREQETETQRKIYRYLRDRGVDVTSEFESDQRIDPLVGLQPMAWWFHPALSEYLQWPASLYVGGVDEGLGGKLFGISMHGEDIVGNDPERLTGFLHEFCLQTAPWYFLNRQARLKVELTADASTAFFSGGIVTSVDRGGRITMTEQGRLVRDGSDILVPALWREERSEIAYSADGYGGRWWSLPPQWNNATEVNAAEITLSGLKPLGHIRVSNGKIQLTLIPDQALLLTLVH
jgi:hypothetical protein